MRKITVNLFKGKKKQFYFHVQAKNRKIICASEGYNTKQSAMKTIKLLQGANDWSINDLTV
jgi:uncharacterized protein YegP (UPF0339 family)